MRIGLWNVDSGLYKFLIVMVPQVGISNLRGGHKTQMAIW